MDVIKELYLSQGLTAKKAQRIIKKVNKGKYDGLYQFLIQRSPSKNPLEIVDIHELGRMIKRDEKIRIVGLAEDMHEATELVRVLFNDVYQATSDVNLNGYFL